MLINEKLISSLEYISEVRKNLPEELSKMTEILNDIRENLNNVIEKNNNKQEEVVRQLIEVQKKLSNFPQIIITQQGLLQIKMVAVSNKIKQLNETMINQQKELNSPMQTLNGYFDKFEQQLEKMKTHHLQILEEGITIFNELWESLQANHESIEITWQSTQQEIEILSEKVNYLEEVIEYNLENFTNQINDYQEDISSHLEDNLKPKLANYSTDLEELLEQSINNIEQEISSFRENSEANIEKARILFKDKINNFREELTSLIDSDSTLEKLTDHDNLFTDNGKEIEIFIEKLKKLITDIEEVGESLGVN